MPEHWIEITALGTLVLALLAELLHLSRARRLGRLAFGASERPRAWTLLVPPLRACCISAVCWALLVLTTIDPREHSAKEEVPVEKFRRVLMVLDVSPSMMLSDAGPEGSQERSKRAGDVMQSVLERIVANQTRFSVIAAYTGGQRVVVDTADLNVVRNILNDLPMRYAFKPGKTQLTGSLNEAAELAKEWPKHSATLILVSDGDTLPDTGLKPMPPSIQRVMVVGVGNSRTGTFIDGHQSRQDASALRGIARRLGGTYYDANEKHLPSDALKTLAQVIPMQDEKPLDRRMLAIVLLLAGSALLALMPPLLEFFGAPRRHLRYKG